ncbi:Fibroblast growth factor receptor 4, partial [Geodia barretti]
MPQPYNTVCSEEIYGIMIRCWHMAPEDRPTFKELYCSVSQSIERDAGYLQFGFNPFTGGGGEGGGG